jgi:hypothetical protein
LDQSQEDWPAVQVQPLDEAIQHLNRVDLVKIDVEGSETRVIDGATQVISRFRPVLILEVNRTQLQKLGSSDQELLGRLTGLGYICHVRQHKRLREISPADLNNDVTFNVIAVPKNRALQSIRRR